MASDDAKKERSQSSEALGKEEDRAAYSAASQLSSGQLCPQAVDFVYGAATLVRDIVDLLETNQIDPKEARRRMKIMLKDIHREIEDCPHPIGSNTVLNKSCSQCLVDYNAAVASGVSVAIALAQYRACINAPCT